jgi:hypothetical protein
VAVRSVVDVEVNDEQFRAFSEKFEKYKEALAKTGATWGSIGGATKGVEATFAAIVAATVVQVELLHKATKEQQDGANAASRSETLWSSMARSTRSVAGNIVKATESLLKWTALTSVFSGLLGAGGLFGIDRLAGSVNAGRRSSLGVGTTYGEQAAFGTSFSRFVDPGSFLSSVNESLHDLTKRHFLYGLGLSEGDLFGKDTAGVAALALTRIKAIADRTPSSQDRQAMHAFGVDQFMSQEDFARARSSSPSEFARQQGLYKQNKSAFDLSPEEQLAWANFKTQLDNAGTSIENIFVRGLSPLAGPLSHLSDSVTKALQTFFEVAKQQHWVEKFGAGIEWVANYIGTKEFRDNVSMFVQDIGILARTLHGVIQWIGGGVTPSTVGGAFHDRIQQNAPELEAGAARWRIGLGTFASIAGGFLNPSGAIGDAALWAIRQIESGGGKHLVSPKGALGEYQLMPGTARALGVNPMDPAQAKAGARALLTQLYGHYDGDIAKTLAAYNWGQGSVDRDVARNGAGWRDHLPSETSNYLVKFLKAYANTATPRASVTVHNNTGGNVVISASQIAPPHNPAVQ